MPDAAANTDETAQRALALAVAHAAACLGIHPRDEQDWLHITRLIALVTPATASTSLHDGNRPPGRRSGRGGPQRTAPCPAAGHPRSRPPGRAIRMVARNGTSRGLDVVSLARFAFGRDSKPPPSGRKASRSESLR